MKVVVDISIKDALGNSYPFINPDEATNLGTGRYNCKAYLVTLALYATPFAVFAPCNEDALDMAVDYAEEFWPGLFLDVPEYESDEQMDAWDQDNNVLYAGNHGRALDSQYVHIQEVTS